MKTLSQLPVGALIKDTNTKYNNKTIIWQVLEHGHAGDPSGSTTLAARDIITLKCFDAKEPNNSDSNRKSYGNNRYAHSNILSWLNSNASSWYTAKHTADQAPDSSNVWQSSGTAINPYSTEAGFLTHFSTNLRNALMTVSKTTAKNTVTDGGSYESVSSKVFLLSNTEVGLANENNIAEGTIYSYYAGSNNTNARRQKNLANDAAKGNYASASSPWLWWLRTPYAGSSRNARFVYTDGCLGDSRAYSGSYGVVPALCISSSSKVSDSTDSDGAYTIQWNSAPVISTPSTNLGDKNAPFSITWSCTDPDSDAVSAVVKVDGTTKQTIATVSQGTTYTYSVSASDIRNMAVGAHTITITATDSNSLSGTKTISFNRVASSVTISGADGSLGNFWFTPTITYTVGETDGKRVDVVESYEQSGGEAYTTTRENVTLEQSITVDMSHFEELTDEGTATLTITATNSDGAYEVRTWTFKKLADRLVFYTDTVATDLAAKSILVMLKYNETHNPTVKIEATNNGTAVSPTWEDVTEAWSNAERYDFTNEPEEGFGVAVKVTVFKNQLTERVSVQGLGFAFS